MKSTFCCSVNHSGSAGKCDKVVVNTSTKRCAFVEDIQSCDQLPSGWGKAGLCPIDYQWEKEDVVCVKDTPKVKTQVELTFFGKIICFFKKIFGLKCSLGPKKNLPSDGFTIY